MSNVNFDSSGKYECRIKVRKDHNGRELNENPKIINGLTMILSCPYMFTTVSDYPCELNMQPEDADDKEMLNTVFGSPYIPSGDVEIIAKTTQKKIAKKSRERELNGCIYR